jgi:hypothetical protein
MRPYQEDFFLTEYERVLQGPKQLNFKPGTHFFGPEIILSKVLFGTTHFHGVNYTMRSEI